MAEATPKNLWHMRRGPSTQWTLCGLEARSPAVIHVAVVAASATLFGRRWCEACRRRQASLLAFSRLRLSKAAMRMVWAFGGLASGAALMALKIIRKGGRHG